MKVLKKKAVKKKVNPATLKRKLDRIWSLTVRAKYENKCIICGSTSNPNAHHLIHRIISKYRWDVNNGVCLCPKHHLFGLDISAHKGPFLFFEFLRLNHQDIMLQYVVNIYNITKEKLNLEEIEKELLKEYEKYIKKG